MHRFNIMPKTPSYILGSRQIAGHQADAQRLTASTAQGFVLREPRA
ncbi:MAG: hypothetical protein ACLGJA_22055 [Gammaproteobacteria bacterium]